jgi:chemotaxis protein MotB
MTLLFGFFVMLSAFSTPSGEKLEQLKRAASESLGGRYTRPYEDLSAKVSSVLQDYALEKDTRVRETEDGLRVTIRGTVFFDSGSADLRPEAKALLGKLADVLLEKAADHRIVVEGHTDDEPIASPRFPSNWELSASRASVVVRLLEERGFDGRLLRPLGLADKEPLAPNRDSEGRPLPENQAENRRIVLRIQKNLIPRVESE